IASESWASTIRTLAPCEIRFSTSVSCLSADDWASVEMYLAPAASSTPLIAASSVFQRSSWKLFQETPTTVCAAASPTVARSPAAASVTVRIFLTFSLPMVVSDQWSLQIRSQFSGQAARQQYRRLLLPKVLRRRVCGSRVRAILVGRCNEGRQSSAQYICSRGLGRGPFQVPG